MFETIGEGHKIMAEGPKKEIDLDELERLAKAATPGPWKLMLMKTPLHHFFLPEDFPHSPVIGQAKTDNDAAYIVAACNAVPELIARVRELERQRMLLAKELVSRGHILGSVADTDLYKPWIEAAEKAAKDSV